MQRNLARQFDFALRGMLELQTENRKIFGKKLEPFRKKGKLPAVLYGPKEKTQSLFVSLKDFKKIWNEAGESTVIQLKLDGSKKEVLIQEVAMDPIKDEPLHVDFYAVQMDKPIQTSVALVFEGVSPAIKNFGGILVKVTHEIEIEALPKNLPHELIVDVSSLANLEDKISAKDIILPTDVKLITNPEEVIVLVETPKEEAVAPAEEKIAFEEIEVVGKKEKEEEEERSRRDAKIKDSKMPISKNNLKIFLGFFCFAFLSFSVQIIFCHQLMLKISTQCRGAAQAATGARISQTGISN